MLVTRRSDGGFGSFAAFWHHWFDCCGLRNLAALACTYGDIAPRFINHPNVLRRNTKSMLKDSFETCQGAVSANHRQSKSRPLKLHGASKLRKTCCITSTQNINAHKRSQTKSRVPRSPHTKLGHCPYHNSPSILTSSPSTSPGLIPDLTNASKTCTLSSLYGCEAPYPSSSSSPSSSQSTSHEPSNP